MTIPTAKKGVIQEVGVSKFQQCRVSLRGRGVVLWGSAQVKNRVQGKLLVLKQGAAGQDWARVVEAEVACDLEELRKISGKEALSAELRAELASTIKRLSATSTKLSRARKIHRRMRRLSAVKRNAYQHAIALVYKHSKDPTVAHRLVEAMLYDLSKEH